MAKRILLALMLALALASPALGAVWDFYVAIPAGDSADLKIDCQDADGDPFDFAGWTLTFRLARPAGGILLVKAGSQVELVGGDPTGRVTVHVYAGEVSMSGNLPATLRATRTVDGRLLQQSWLGTLKAVPHP